MPTVHPLLRDKTYTAGLFSLAISLAVFCLPYITNMPTSKFEGLFLVNAAVALTYLVIQRSARKKSTPEFKIHHSLLALINLTIAAFALNRDLPVFAESSPRFSVVLVLVCSNFIAMAFAGDSRQWIKQLMSFINGAAFIVFLYMACYLMPVYVFGILGFLLLGIPLLCFVPVFMCAHIPYLQIAFSRERKNWIAFYTGVVASLLLVGVYTARWMTTINHLNKQWAVSTAASGDIPSWVRMSQEMEPDDYSLDIMMDEPVPYFSGFGLFDFDFGRVIESGRKGAQYHDPLQFIARFFAPELKIDEDNKVKILGSMADKRHELVRLYWSDDQLVTKEVKTAVRIWPSCNLAYTEKTMLVGFQHQPEFSRPKEALYTFYLPEGAFVSSLSLWVNGKEEKGALTTKGRAEAAYQQIVGVESRDPSIVHWQEGNTVTVRVFPVTSEMPRQVKIGITSPLDRLNGKLHYENIYFKGPSFDDASEELLLDFEQPVSHSIVPASFAAKGSQQFARKGSYLSRWGISIDDPGLNNCRYSFGNNTYSILPYSRRLQSSATSALYLDVNSSWTRREFDEVFRMGGDRAVYVWNTRMVQLTKENLDSIWLESTTRSFSLFPLYEINDPSGAILITKGGRYSPGLEDIRGSAFSNRLSEFLKSAPAIRLFNLDTKLTPYLATLKEFRVFRYDEGDTEILRHLLEKNIFVEDAETEDRVVVHQANIQIEKSEGITGNGAPDHVMRLFAYNHVMKGIGKDLLAEREIGNSLVEEARQSHIVTPLSSLIVLEMQADYDRFDIKRETNGLGNASLKGNGAVPEPHEWALIIAGGLFLLFVYRRNKMKANHSS